MKPMTSARILFAGTRGLSTKCLKYLLANNGDNKVSAVLGAPRGAPTWWAYEGEQELWDVADAHGIRYIEEPELEHCSYDFVVSVMWNKVFSAAALSRATRGGINFHPAPLPEYRGSFGRTHAILNQEKDFAVTIHLLAPRVDAGDIIADISFPIGPAETALSLDTRAQDYGFPLFCIVWRRLLDGSVSFTSQEKLVAEGARKARFYPLSAMDELIRSQEELRSDEELERLFRALYIPPRLSPPEWLSDRLGRSRPVDKLPNRANG